MPATKCILLAWWANFISFMLIGGSAATIFLNENYRAIASVGILSGIFIQWYFKNKADKRAQEAHSIEMKNKKN